MNEYQGKICPLCKTTINEGDEVTVCPVCKTPHHTICWQKNNGCASAGCSKQQLVAPIPAPDNKCHQCGAVLEEGQSFCPSCGAQKTGNQPHLCSGCGAEIAEGQAFCPKCGKKVDTGTSIGANPSIPQPKKPKSGKLLIGGIVGVVVIIAIIVAVVVLGGMNKVDFNKQYKDMANNNWCTIASDGLSISIDSNPSDIDDYFNEDADEAVQTINKDLGFSDALWQKMGETSSLDGRQTDSNDKYTVSWKYHPDHGLEVTYEVKK